MEDNTIPFKGFRQLNGIKEGFDASELENGYLYLIRTNSEKNDGYIIFNGKRYATASDALSTAKKYTDDGLKNKFDKTGGTVNGSIVVKGSINIDTNSRYGLGVRTGFLTGNLTDSKLVGRYFCQRVTASGYQIESANSIGYNPKINTVSTQDYGMKFQVAYGSNIGKELAAVFYLSYSGCMIGYSGLYDGAIKSYYNVHHDGNAYSKTDIDAKIQDLQAQIDVLTQLVATTPDAASIMSDMSPLTIGEKESLTAGGMTPEDTGLLSDETQYDSVQ